jgi:hypothetical protein
MKSVLLKFEKTSLRQERICTQTREQSKDSRLKSSNKPARDAAASNDARPVNSATQRCAARPQRRAVG